MPTVRKDPSRYNAKHYEIMQQALKTSIELKFISHAAAISHRMLLYAVRASLRSHPEYNPELAANCDKLTFIVGDSTLTIKLKAGQTISPATTTTEKETL